MNGRKKRTPRRTIKKRSRTRITPRAVIVICLLAAFLVAGTFFAAQQHFYVVDYGMKNSRLKKQIDDLEAEKRRLLLAREVALSPAELKRAAKRLGVVPSTATSDETVKVSSIVKEKAMPPKPAQNEEASSEGNPFVVKTAATAPNGGETRERKAAAKPLAERGESRQRIAN
ncbi:MAG: hypothetical protein IPM50_02115 [Acidobacteriota bacterium]|nr:MAG: hypothetical protein IPM50_02115 [Acidobacteriota bacterium]